MPPKLLLLLFLFTAACHPKKTEPAADLPATKTDTSNTLSYVTNPGERIAVIEFNYLATTEEKADYEGDTIWWISIENPEPAIPRLIDADKIVVLYKEVSLIIDYPLNKPVTIPLVSTGEGFSRKELIRAISKEYHRIYKEEEESASTKTVPADKREGIINRNSTDGKYGIWGHDLGDLDLSEIEVFKSKDNKIILILSVES